MSMSGPALTPDRFPKSQGKPFRPEAGGFRRCLEHDVIECIDCWPPATHAETKAERSLRLRWEADQVEGPEAPEQPAPEPVPTYQIGEVLGDQVVTLVPLHMLQQYGAPTVTSTEPREMTAAERVSAAVMLVTTAYQVGKSLRVIYRSIHLLSGPRGRR